MPPRSRPRGSCSNWQPTPPGCRLHRHCGVSWRRDDQHDRRLSTWPAWTHRWPECRRRPQEERPVARSTQSRSDRSVFDWPRSEWTGWHQRDSDRSKQPVLEPVQYQQVGFRAWRAQRIRTRRRRKPRRGQCQSRLCWLNGSSSYRVPSWLIGDGLFYRARRSSPISPTGNSASCRPTPPGANSRYVIDNESFPSAVTVTAYKLV